MYSDILDDLFTPAQELAKEFKDFTADFDHFMGPAWSNKLVGPDSGAIGSKISRTGYPKGYALVQKWNADVHP